MQLESIKTTQLTPSNPTGTASATAVMMGLADGVAAGSIKLQGSGRLLIMLSGDIKNDTTGDGATVQLSYGTGTAPANGAALAGTQVGNTESFTALTGVLVVPFSQQAVVSGLTVGTTYWLDAAVKAVTGGTASILNLSLTAIEL